MPSQSPQNNSFEGFAFGLLGFSFTLPATKIAVATLDPMLVGLGRALIAACLAAPLLFITRQKKPTGHQWHSIVVVLLGVIVGFPMLSAWAMRLVPASHGAVVLGLLPLATAIAGTIRTHERPSPAFWYASAFWSLAVVVYAFGAGDGGYRMADFAGLCCC